MAITWTVDTQTDFDKGTYVNTTSNASGVILHQEDYYNYSGFSSFGNKILYYRLNNNSAIGEGSVVVDESGKGNNGTINGAPAWNNSGKFGAGMSFNGSTDYISTSVTSNTNAFTISAWFSTSESYAALYYGQIIMWGDSPTYSFLAVKDGGVIEGVLCEGDDADSVVTGTSIVNDGKWHHVVGVCTINSGQLYVDGVLEDTSSGFDDCDDNGNLRIGCNTGGVVSILS